MWICLPMGMYMPALRPAHTIPAGDDRLLQIRARRRVDLDRLRRELLPELGDTVHLKHTDYEFRAYCTHEQWANALAQAALDIDYVKFKEQSEVKYNDKKLHDVYTAMWYTVFSKMSTKAHQSDYWGAQNKAFTSRGKNRQAGTSRYVDDAKHWWEDAENGASTKSGKTLRDLIDSDYGITSDDIQRFGGEYDDDPEIQALVKNWDDKDVPVTRRPNGSIDHRHCAHAKTKNARRRCRNRAARENTQ